MANSTIPNLPIFAGTPSGTEPMETVQSGLSVQIPSQKIADLATIVTPLTKTAMDALVAGSQVSPYKLYLITNAVSNTRRLLVKGETTTTLEDTAIDMSTGEIGTYVLSTDIFTATSGVTPTLQQVLDAGNTSTTSLSIDDGAGSSIYVKSSSIDIYNTLGGQASIQSQSLTFATTFEIPNKAAGIETFAMLSDITGAITGAGTVNELAYFTAGQVIASLSVATYPSLTELSMVKGVGSQVVGTTDTNTLTNKRITARTGTVASNATPTINTDNVDYYSITALAAAITSFTTNLSGTPTIGQTLWISIKDNGTARAIAWGASFEASTIALPTTTVISTRLDVAFIWNEATSVWRCVGVA
jgi:hypothetical protein